MASIQFDVAREPQYSDCCFIVSLGYFRRGDKERNYGYNITFLFDFFRENVTKQELLESKTVNGEQWWTGSSVMNRCMSTYAHDTNTCGKYFSRDGLFSIFNL